MSSVKTTHETIDMNAIEAELRPLSTENLKLRFSECYSGAAKFIAEAGMIVKLLKERGENLSDIPLVGSFLRVAHGQTLPELLWRFIDSPNRRYVESLPLEDQRRLVKDPMVTAIEDKPGGGYTKRMVDLTKAPAEVMKLVVGPEGLRSPEEQMAHVGYQRISRTVASPKEEPGSVQEPLSHRLSVRLTDSELEAVKVAAAKARISESDMVRRFLVRGMKEPKS